MSFDLEATFDRPSQAVGVPVPDLGLTGQDYADHTRPAMYAEADNDWAWTRYLSGLAELLDPVARVVRPRFGLERWCLLANPTYCPSEWLYVLAQWAGVAPRVYNTMTERQLRDLIGPHAPGMWRGTRPAMVAAIRRFLQPGSPIFFEERAITPQRPDGDPYVLRVFVFGFSRVERGRDYRELLGYGYTYGQLLEMSRADTPGFENYFMLMRLTAYDPVRILQALNQAKPAGLQLDFQVRYGQTYGMLRDRHDTYQEVFDTYPDYEAVVDAEPIGTDIARGARRPRTNIIWRYNGAAEN